MWVDGSKPISASTRLRKGSKSRCGETYGSGRYLDVHSLGDELLLDFNYAYNPYCAYNERWSCPIPPAENRLDVPIEAGERAFEAHA